MGSMGLGVYVSVPFCKAKCSFCNFASGVFAGERMRGYVERVCGEIAGARAAAERMGAEMAGRAGTVVNTVYLGGGTPSLLAPELVRELFGALRGEFAVDADAEVTVECAPGQLEEATLEAMLEAGVNRLSFGVQSFVDRECAAVGRLHTGRRCREELARVAAAGVKRVGVDLIVGLPHQTLESWRESVDQAVESGVEHVSVYMLEVDEGSRLGREFLRGGERFGAKALPADDRVADWYAAGCEWLAAGGVRQYEISNFARVGGESRHNRKYWTREPYVGFGMDAHSMLRVGAGGVRWANADSMEAYMDGAGLGEAGAAVERVGQEQGFEEAVFLGLRLVEGVSVESLKMEFGEGLVDGMMEGLREVEEAGLVELSDGRVRLTGAGRMVSNEVFERALVVRV